MPNAWNTLPIAATLTPGANYWLVYNTNGSSDGVNNMRYDAGASGQGVYTSAPVACGTWPAAFPASTLFSARYSIFATLGPPDATAPSVTLTNPGSPISGAITLTATASDNIGVTRVEFYCDGTLIGTDASAPYGTPFDTTTVANGSHTLTARAFDAANNPGASAPVSTTIANVVAAPAILPAGGSFAGSVTVSLTTTTSAATIRYTLDGTDPSAASTPYSVAFTLTASRQ